MRYVNRNKDRSVIAENGSICLEVLVEELVFGKGITAKYRGGIR